ncbi:FG-GAP repeat [Micromonospora mirobrigensis]|uniref:FG-GAP repeat n=1 Tax=Micromonospora mirobrigensis TaxID=262898 RepID=A0A1C5AGV5_9ACTN|nr:FG-GAP repeat [Micromonospora mirobrigensis]
MGQLLSLESGSQNGGIYANKPGYHNTRAGNATNDYSVRDQEDQGGPSDKAAAYDWTFPDAQGFAPASSPTLDAQPVQRFAATAADYSAISRYSQRLLASGRNPNDPRMDGWREFYGQADTDSGVEGYDFRYDRDVSSDPSHLWHIHLSEDRDKTTSMDNKVALLSVLRGETVEQWRNRATADFDGDGSSDLALYRPDPVNGSLWNIRSWKRGVNIYTDEKWGGKSSDIPLTGDFDNDGVADMAIYRRDCAVGSTWWIKNGASGVQTTGDMRWGGCNDIPSIGDVNGDGYDDLVLYRQDCTTGSTWQMYNVRLKGTIQTDLRWGGCKDLPLTGDVNGDGYDDLVLYRQDCTAGSTWQMYNVRLKGAIQTDLRWGGCKDIPSTGDVNGDGHDDLVLYRQDCTTGSTWQTYNVRYQGTIRTDVRWGGCHDIPVTADFNADGYADLGTYRQDCTSGSTWNLYNFRLGGVTDDAYRYGGCADLPVTKNSINIVT